MKPGTESSWSSLSGGHDRFRAGMSFAPKKDTPAESHAAHANSVSFRRCARHWWWVLAVLATLAGSVPCHAQVITTVAGNGRPGFSGDGGPATSAQLGGSGGVLGVAVDSAGNLYITDGSNNRVRKVTPAGIITTVAGGGMAAGLGDGGPATSAQVFPSGVGVDSAGNLFISAGSLRNVNTAGTITTVAAINASNVASDGAGNRDLADR